jgi:hypothetical protein
MKITLEIPDESILCTVSIATQTERNVVSLGVFPIFADDLKDGKTVDFKTSYDRQNKQVEKGGA